MAAGKLTALKVKALTVPGVYGIGDGLYLQVTGTAGRSWLFRYKRGGKTRWTGLGACRDVSLAEAREAATAARRIVRQGSDPIDAKRAERAAVAARAGLNTFAEVAEAFIVSQEASWRNAKHRQQWRNTLATYVYPVIGKKGVAVIGTADVTRVLEPILIAKPETAARVRGRIESILAYATAKQWRTGDNPAERRYLALPKRNKSKGVVHHAALEWADMGAFMAALREQRGIGARALEWTILTAARSGETRGATWGEVDMSAGVWTVPEERMKAGKLHRIPLSDAAMDVLRAMKPLREARGADTAAIFPGARPGSPLSDMSLTAVLRRMERGDLTAHGFRSTFRDWCAEATNYPRELAEAALAHTLRDKVEAAYQRGDLLDKRRKLMDEWAAYCGRVASASAVVVPLRRA